MTEHPTLLPSLPEGYAARHLTRGDARAVYELMAAQQRHDTDVVEIEEADIVGDWQQPSYDLAGSSVGILGPGDEGSALVACAEVFGHEHADTAVHPAHRGRGIGTALAIWVQRLARERGLAAIGMPVPRGSDGDRLLKALGFEARWESWFLELPTDMPLPERPAPPGYALRTAREEEVPAVWALSEDAFIEWEARERTPYDDWCARVVRPDFEPWHLRVATDRGGDVVGMVLVQPGGAGTAEPTSFVAKLATRPDQRRRGLGQALLADAFAAAAAHGARRHTLATDSRTGALGLYERVGMRVASSWVNRGITL